MRFYPLKRRVIAVGSDQGKKLPETIDFAQSCHQHLTRTLVNELGIRGEETLLRSCGQYWLRTGGRTVREAWRGRFTYSVQNSFANERLFEVHEKYFAGINHFFERKSLQTVALKVSHTFFKFYLITVIIWFTCVKNSQDTNRTNIIEYARID